MVHQPTDECGQTQTPLQQCLRCGRVCRWEDGLLCALLLLSIMSIREARHLRRKNKDATQSPQQRGVLQGSSQSIRHRLCQGLSQSQTRGCTIPTDAGGCQRQACSCWQCHGIYCEPSLSVVQVRRERGAWLVLHLRAMSSCRLI